MPWETHPPKLGAMVAMHLSQGTRTPRSAARIVAAYALAFLIAAPCYFVPGAIAAPAAGAQHAACDDQAVSPDSGFCLHVTSPAAVGATATANQFAPSHPLSAAVPAFAVVPAARRVLAPPRKPPPLAAGPVPLFLLHLRLLN